MAAKRLPRVVTVPLVLLVIVLLAWLLLRMLPSGFETDLSLVGTGEPAVVLVHDHNYVESVTLMENLARVRDQHPEAMLYLVADLNHPRGQRFADNQDVDAVTLVLFDLHGNRVATTRGVKDSGEIEQWLADHLPPL
ncbi:hypothetical protein [Natronospira sp.]|uniref:hypothetical protein n=1 Tax=Natronospira sp. TaxID=2024970 RepID=UPI0038732824